MILDQPSDAMMKEAGQWLEIVLSLPDGSQKFQQELIRATTIEDGTDFEALRRYLTLAAAAMTMGDHDGSTFAPWYREKARTLMCQAYNAAAAIEAVVMRPEGAATN